MPRWIPAATALVAVVVLLNTLGNEFTFDDGGALKIAERLGSSDFGELGRALTYATHRLDQALWGDWIPGHRLTNLLLYGVATALVTLAAARLTASAAVALWCGLLFVVHPVHAEAVASIAFRKDVLAMIFVLSTLLLWGTERRPVAATLGAACCFVLGLLAKEVAVVGLVPFLYLWQRQNPRRALVRLVPLAVLGALAVVFLAGTLHAPEAGGALAGRFTPAGILKITEGKLHSYGAVVATAARSFLDVLRLLVFPLRLSAEYVTPVQPSLAAPGVLLGVLGFGACVAAAIWAARRGKQLVYLGIAWTLLLYLPASNLVPLTHFFVADRYLLVPSFGVCLLAAAGLTAWRDAWRRRATWSAVPVALGILLVGAGAARTALRNRDWRNEESLWSAALRQGSNTYRAHYNMGNALAQRQQFDAARSQFEAALALYPAAPWARRNLVEILFRQERFAEAESNLRTLLRYEPQDILGRYSLARVLARQGRYADALAECKTVLVAERQHVGASYMAGACLERLGERDAAVAAYRRTLEAVAAARCRGETPDVQESQVEARLRALAGSP